LIISSILLPFLIIACDGSVGIGMVDGDADDLGDSELIFPGGDPASDGDGPGSPDGKEPRLAVQAVLDFGHVIYNTTEVRELPIYNEGEAPLQIDSIALSDATSSEFVLIDAPAASVMVNNGGSLIQRVQYTPVNEGADQGALIIYSHDPLSPVTRVQLTSAYKGHAQIRVSPEQGDFGVLKANGEKTWLEFTVTNVPAAEDDNKLLRIYNLHLEQTGESLFRLMADVPDEVWIAPNDSYRFSVSFDPAAEGVHANRLVIACNDPAVETGALPIDLAAEAALPHLVLEPHPTDNEIRFESAPVGLDSQEKLTLRNAGNWPLTLAAIGLDLNSSPNFSLLDADGLPLTADAWTPLALGKNEFMDLTIRYAPQSFDADVGFLVIESDSEGISPTFTRIGLSGVGAAAGPSVQPDLLDFGDVLVGDASETKSFQIANRSPEIVTVTALSFATGAEFSFPGGNPIPVGGLELPPGGETDVSVVYSPADEGRDDDTIAIELNGGALEPLSVTLTGRGVAPRLSVEAPELAAFAGALDFGQIPIDRTRALTVKLVSSGTAPLEIGGISATPETSPAFSFAHDALRTLPPGESLTMTVTFAPLAPAADHAGLLEIQTNEIGGGLASIALTGLGADVRAVVTPPDNPFDIGVVLSGHTEEQPFAIAREGFGALTILDVRVAPTSRGTINGFEVFFETTNPFPLTIANGDATPFPFTLTFTPPGEGDFTATLIVETTDYLTPVQRITLNGHSASSDASPFVQPASPYDFGGAYPNATLAASFGVWNQGTLGDLIVVGGVLRTNEGSSYRLVLPEGQYPLPYTVTPEDSIGYPFVVTFTPPAIGDFQGELVLVTFAGGRTIETPIALTGQGVPCPDGCWNNDGNPTDCEYCGCWETNAGIEICDGLDNDCDGFADEEDEATLLSLCSAPNHSEPFCNGGACDFACDIDFHRCGDFCVYNESAEHCGGRCEACPAPENSVVWCADLGAGPRCGFDCYPSFEARGDACVGASPTECCGEACENCYETVTPPEHGYPACLDGACGFLCNAGFHLCGDLCVADDSLDHCGANCEPCQPPENAAAVCNGIDCGFLCNDGYHREGLACVFNGDIACCGAECLQCTAAPDFAYPVCVDDACGFACFNGYHRCGDECRNDESPDSCGDACAPCPAPANGAPTCRAGVCGFACDFGFHEDGGACVVNANPDCCGPECLTCTEAPLHGYPLCVGEVCGFECFPGYHRCGDSCLDDDSPASCGGDCEPCPAPANALTTCEAGVCGSVCLAGFHLDAGACAPNSNPDCCGLPCQVCTAPPNATPICVDDDHCDFVCNNGYQRSGDLCLPEDSVACCGELCETCTEAPEYGHPACIDDACSFVCEGGYHRCGDACVSNLSLDSCGTSCAPCPAPDHGIATCNGVACGVQCETGYHPIEGACISNTDATCCGPQCTDCTVIFPQHQTAYCLEGSFCSYTCNQGFHKCDGVCVSNYSTESCGHDCTPCPTIPNATEFCISGHCKSVCNTGYHETGSGDCAPNDTVECCGVGCANCGPGPAHGSTACEGGACVTVCGAGYHLCGTKCVANNSVNTCGGRCDPCPIPANGFPTCDGANCGVACKADYHLEGGVCVPD